MRVTHPIISAVIVLLLGSICHAQQSDDPFATPPGTTSEAEWGSDRSEGGWAGTVASIGEDDLITSGGIGCPVIVAGSKVFSTENFALLSTLDVDYRSNTHAALSADGSYFAVAAKSHNHDDTAVLVFDVATGKKVSEIPGREDSILDILLIARNKYVVTAGRSDPVVRVWSAETGEMVREFPIGENVRLDQGNVALTSDAAYMAVVADKQLNVLQAATSKVVATMEPPNSVEPEEMEGRVSSIDHVFIYAWIQDLKFSPDGKELAAVSTHRGNRILCWSQNGKLTLNQTFLPVQDKAFWENDLQWLPDGNSWLIGGNLVDRSNGDVLLASEVPFGEDVILFVHDQNTLLGRLGSKPNQLSKCRIPWEEIQRSRKAIEEKTPAYIAPYVPVDVRFDLSNAEAPVEEVEKKLGAALRNRLARSRVDCQPGSPNYLQLTFSESEGETLAIIERRGIWDRRGKQTGETATEMNGVLIIEFCVEGRLEPLWRQTLRGSSSRSIEGEINQQSIRESMLSMLAVQLAKMHFPYFMPKDENLTPLPVMLK